MTRLIGAWQAMDRDRHLATLASIALFISMFLPWYQQNGVAKTGIESGNLDAFQVFSFVEAAVLLVAMALIFMLFARAEGREFNTPGGDGTVVFAAGIWTGALLIFRLFDKPGISSHGVAGNVGVQWGIFFALAAAAMITYSGSRMRTAERELLHARPATRRERPPEREPEPEPDIEAPQAPPSSAELPPEEEPTRRVVAPARAPTPARAGGRGRRPFPPTPDEQLSFEEEPPGPQ